MPGCGFQEDLVYRGGATGLRGAARSQAFYSRGDLYDRVAEGSRIQEKQAMPAAEDLNPRP